MITVAEEMERALQLAANHQRRAGLSSAYPVPGVNFQHVQPPSQYQRRYSLASDYPAADAITQGSTIRQAQPTKTSQYQMRENLANAAVPFPEAGAATQAGCPVQLPANHQRRTSLTNAGPQPVAKKDFLSAGSIFQHVQPTSQHQRRLGKGCASQYVPLADPFQMLPLVNTNMGSASQLTPSLSDDNTLPNSSPQRQQSEGADLWSASPSRRRQNCTESPPSPIMMTNLPSTDFATSCSDVAIVLREEVGVKFEESDPLANMTCEPGNQLIQKISSY